MGLNINNVVVAGRLGCDPELKVTANKGTATCSFSLANTYAYYSPAKGETVKETSWYGVKAWGKLAEICASDLQKGDAVVVEGRLHQDTWEDKDTGKKVSKVRIIANKVHFILTKKYSERASGAEAPEAAEAGCPF